MITRIGVLLTLLAAVVCAETHYSWQENFNRLDLLTRGTVEFADNDADVKTLSNDGYFRLEQSGLGSSRVYIVRPGSNGLERLYSVDGSSKALDAEGRAWLGRVLPEVIRESAIGASDRVKRILRQQGSSGVFAEIAKIRSDHARRVYIEKLLEYGRLNGVDLREAMRYTRKIGSDGEKATLLIAAAPHYQENGVRESYFDAVDTISSDGEHRRALNAVLDRYGPDRETLAQVLRSAKRISSDGEKANVLVRAADFRLTDDTVQVNYFRAADSVSSDGEHRRVLSSVLKKNGADKDILLRALRSAAGIHSDGEKTNVLVQAADDYMDDPIVRRALFDAIATISSDGEKRRALSAFAQRGIADIQVDVARSAAHIHSDGEKANVLIALLNQSGADPVIVEAVAEAANTVSSDGEHARVLMAALNGPGLAKDSVIQVIHSAEKISSDGEKGRVLGRAAQRYSNDAQIAAVLRAAAKTIQSDGEYRRLMSMLF